MAKEMATDCEELRDFLFPSPGQALKNTARFVVDVFIWGVVWITISVGLLFLALM